MILTLAAAATMIGMAPVPALAQTTATWVGGAGIREPSPPDDGTALWNTCPSDYNPGKGNNDVVGEGSPVTVGAAEGLIIANLDIATGGSATRRRRRNLAACSRDSYAAGFLFISLVFRVLIAFARRRGPALRTPLFSDFSEPASTTRTGA